MPSGKYKRAANGNGSLRKKVVVKNGRKYEYWEGRITVGKDGLTGKQIQKSITGKNRTEVAKKMTELSYMVNSGKYRPEKKIRFSDWLRIWQESYLIQLKPSTKRSYQDAIKLYIDPMLGGIELQSLTSASIQAFVSKLAEEKNPGTIQHIFSTLNVALKQAVIAGYINSNPAEHCVLPKKQTVSDAQRTIPEEKIILFIEEAQKYPNENIGNMLICALGTGMRLGELLGLTWDCVDWEKNEIRVEKQLIYAPGVNDPVYGNMSMGSPKNGKPRTIAMSELVLKCLWRQKTVQQKYRAKNPAYIESNLVFAQKKGGPPCRELPRYALRQITEKIGCPTSKIHDLRHTFATLSVESGGNIKTLQETLGHSSATLTLDRYSHNTSAMKRENSQKLEEFLRTIAGKEKIS